MMGLLLDILNLKCDCDVQERVSVRQLYLVAWYSGGRSRLERKTELVMLTWLNMGVQVEQAE